MKSIRTVKLSVAGLLFVCLTSAAQPATLPDGLREKIDSMAQKTLVDTGLPSASIAIVQGGEIAYLQAYGNGRIEPPKPAVPVMRYSIGSISKQFTASAILLLAEQGRLSLDDPVSRFVPNLTRGNEITIRQLLSHTSGYQDYWPQDYVPPFMLQPTTVEKILDRWARKPLDFDPGTKWQYSNTNYVIAGQIVEKVSGEPLLQFLSEHIFTPLGMKSVINVDQQGLTDSDATGYTRYALGPLLVAPKEGRGWLFAAGELAMTAEDLAKWDISLMNQTLLKTASYAAMERATLLENGVGTGYGLGVEVSDEFGQRAIQHGGGVSGFTTHDLVFPEARMAVVVFTNADSGDVPEALARQIAELLFRDADAAKQEAQAREIFTGLQQGKINRSLFTGNCNSYFTEQALKDFGNSLGPLGAPSEFKQTYKDERGGMTFRLFEVQLAQKKLKVWERVMPDGKIEQYQVM